MTANAPEKKAPEKRSLRLEKVPNSTLCRFAWNGGGELPESLQSHFTSPATAYQILAAYNTNTGNNLKLEDRAGPQVKTPKGER